MGTVSGAWALIKPTDALDFWTMVTGLGTLGLILVAYRGLRSLGLAKKDMLTRGMRDARDCALKRCREFAETIIPTGLHILGRMGEAKIPLLVTSTKLVSFDPDNEQHVKAAGAWCSKAPQDVVSDSIGLLNRVESWAMYFTNGLADHDIAFPPCGAAYCSMIVQSYAVLLQMRTQDSSGKYPNTVKLFKSWHERMEQERRGLQQGNLLRELEKLQAKAPLHPLPKPLGTQLDD